VDRVPVVPEPDVLARGPWAPRDVVARWSADHFVPDPEAAAEADLAIEALRRRGSPSHDGLAARLVRYDQVDGRLELDLQPLRWALRLVPGDAAASVSALCVTRAHDGRWLAGRRAAWLSQWAGRWTLGAGGAVDVGESPAETLERELMEEWSVAPERLTVEALLRLPHGMVMVVGLAWLAPDATVQPDHEHDDHAWWPADPTTWPPEADPALRRMALLLAAP
jgi:ADP-ribose pyrophosphatase YjhB (NUDIX family)